MDRRATVGIAIALAAVALVVWRSRRAAAAAGVLGDLSSPSAPAPSAPGLPTPSRVPDASDPLGVAFRTITGAPIAGRRPGPTLLTPDQIARMKGSADATTVVMPGPAPPMPGTLADPASRPQSVARAAGTLSGLLTGVFG